MQVGEVMRIVGVTGGIGSGKSTVSKILADLGAEIIDADLIARDIVKKGKKAWKEIIEAFGESVLDTSMEIDRAKLGNIVFNDKNKLESLNSITHKYIREEIIQRIENIAAKESNELVIVDAPIPFGWGFTDLVDEVWVVTADLETRIQRVMSRSGLTYAQVVDRINSQKPEKEYLDIADKVLHNDCSIDELAREIEIFLQGDVVV